MPAPTVQHNFDGEQGVLDTTFDRRLEIRKSLHALHQDLRKSQDVPMQVFAEVKIRIPASSGFKEHTYTVQVTDGNYDAAKLANHVENVSSTVNGGALTTTDQASGSRMSPVQVVGAGHPSMEDAMNGDEAEDGRPSKRARIGDGPSDFEQTSVTELNTVLKEVATVLRKKDSSSDDSSDIADFMKEWHEKWAQQGGWLFDNVTKLFAAVNETKQAAAAAAAAKAPSTPANIDRSLASVQQVLSQAINASNASVHGELTKIIRLIPWLEECRKAATDKIQQREEQWRLTSANFHDNARKNRETAEMVLMKRLHEQQQMMEKQWEVMKKLAQANDIELDEDTSSSGRDESLGVQLTRELREEAQCDRRPPVPGARGHAIKVDEDA